MHRLNVRSLRRSLNCLCNCLDELYYINDGGCCFVASLIALHLDKLGVGYELAIFDEESKDSTSINYEVLSMSRMKGSRNSILGEHTCSHYCICIDGAGIVNGVSYDWPINTYKIPGVTFRNIKWVYKNGSWNDCYSTNNNKIVKNIINSFFRKYE